MNHGSSRLNSKFGFTIVELLVVIVVIGILAAITLVSYNGITQKAIVSGIQSDLTNASQQLKIYYQLYSSYPTNMAGNCPTAPTADNAYCLKASTGNTLTYSTNGGTSFALTDTNISSNVSYGMNDTSSQVALAQPTSCPTGFIPVPGSATYGQAGFCVMKYEAKNDGSNNAVSTATGTPWVSITQTSAITTATTACTGCHLITEAEWMTIAQNVLSVASNWSGGTFGSGYIPRGNSNSSAAMDGTTDLTGVNKRTLALTNGQVIWDLSGNVFQLTTGTVTSGQPGVASNNYASWIEWPNVTTNGNLTVNPLPSGTGLSGAGTWNSSKGVGMLTSSTTDAGLHAFIRGGAWDFGSYDGVLALDLNYTPGNSSGNVGFRVSR
jgi:prepilin-type N-terminal cleavage/methylation domain-containing protein